MLLKHPNYYLRFRFNECPRMVILNGFPVDDGLGGDQNYADIPVNHLIRKKENTLELLVGEQEVMEEFSGPDLKCEVELRLKGTVGGNQFDGQVLSVEFSPNYTGKRSDLYKGSSKAGMYRVNDQGEIMIENDGVGFSVGGIEAGDIYFDGVGENIKRNFDTLIDFPEWEFFNSERLLIGERDEDFYLQGASLVEPLINDMMTLFDDKNTEEILKRLELRSNEIDLAFYKRPGQTKEELRASLENVFKKDLSLVPVDNSTDQLIVCFEGRTITKVDAGNMDGTIYFYDEETSSYTFYTFYWIRKNGEWVIAR